MGCTNPDRIGFGEHARGVETVTDIMGRRRWQVRARCTKCHTLMKVNLRLIILVSGPRTSLWDRQCSCKVWGCPGKAVFQAKPHPGVKGWTDMTSANRVGFLGVRPERLDGRPLAPLD